MERRLVLRLLTYWRSLCADREMPALEDVEGTAIPDLWDHCFVIDVANGREPYFTYFGSWHALSHCSNMAGKPVSELSSDSLTGRVTEYLPEVVQRRIPITYGGEFEQPDGTIILYRSILLPLADSEQRLIAVLGGANCRIVTEDEIS